jgi:hypothetical protein
MRKSIKAVQPVLLLVCKQNINTWTEKAGDEAWRIKVQGHLKYGTSKYRGT